MEKRTRVTRREALQAGGALGLSGLASVAAAQPAASSRSHIGKRPAAAHKLKNVILLVADGMSLGAQTLAEPFSQQMLQRSTAWSALLKNPAATHGLLETRSANSLVTDSAAAASAWGCGRHVNNGSLNITPDGKHQLPITQLLKDRGFRTGLVTTDKLTGATPSGFAVNQASRSDYFDIAPQFVDRVDVLLGGGRKYFEAGERPDQRDLCIEYRAKGYALCENRRALRGLNAADRVLGLFADDTLPYTVDSLNAESQWRATPTLAHMTETALDCLADKDRGFFLMVEGARVDHAAHSNDAAALLHEQVAFEIALEQALAFAAERGDTLVIATTDHGNGNPGLNGYGPAYTKTDECFARLGKVRASFDTIRQRTRHLARESGPEAAASRVIDEMCDLRLKPKVARLVGQALVNGDLPDELAVLQRNWGGVLSQVLGNHTAVGFTGVNHTADRVLLSAIGPGAERFAGIRRHGDVHAALIDLLAVHA